MSKVCAKLKRSFTMFENHSKCRIWIFQFWHFPPIFVLLKVTCLVTLFVRKLQVFQKLAKMDFFGTFNELWSTQIVNVARFARVDGDFFCDFQTPCTYVHYSKLCHLNIPKLIHLTSHIQNSKASSFWGKIPKINPQFFFLFTMINIDRLIGILVPIWTQMWFRDLIFFFKLEMILSSNIFR